MNYLSSINWSSFGIVIAIVAVLAIIFSVLIVVVSKLCAVKEDEKPQKVCEHLAGANCGGCGHAGCADFAKSLCEGKANINDCGATSNEEKAKIAEILGVPFVAGAECYAVVHCAGGDNATNKYEYVGNEGCISQISFMAGKKSCSFGCMGGGTCKEGCPYNAILIENGVAVVDRALCQACGGCVKSCPKKIIELIPKSSKVYVACSSHCKGKDVMGSCKVGCIGCGLCAKNCPQGAIEMVDDLPIIDYSKCTGCKNCVAKCPRKCIKEI